MCVSVSVWCVCWIIIICYTFLCYILYMCMHYVVVCWSSRLVVVVVFVEEAFVK